MHKQATEQTLLKKMMEAWSLDPKDATRELRTPNGKLQTYPRNEHLHKAQLLQLRGLL